MLEVLESPGFVTFFLPASADSKFPKSGEERWQSPLKSQRSLRRTLRAIAQYLCFVFATRSSKGLFTPVWNQTIDLQLLREQAGFGHGRLTVDQTVFLTQNIDDSFVTKKKTGAVFVDQTAAYDTVRHCGLTCQLLRLQPDKHMARRILGLIRSRNFTLTIGDSK